MSITRTVIVSIAAAFVATSCIPEDTMPAIQAKAESTTTTEVAEVTITAQETTTTVTEPTTTVPETTTTEAVRAEMIAMPQATTTIPEVVETTTTAPAPTTTVPAPTTTVPAPTTTVPAPTTTTTVAPVPVTPTPEKEEPSEKACITEGRDYVNSLTDSLGVDRIAVVHDPTISHKALFAWDAIELRDCVTLSILAHEVGHYIHALSNNYSWTVMKQDSMDFCVGYDTSTGRCEGGWLSDGGKTSEASMAPGVEHAAHCIGYVLSGIDATYTRCPHQHLIEEAQARINSV